MDKLLILPFDHRSSFVKNIAKTEDIETIKRLKNIIFEGFLQTWRKSEEKDGLAILVDDEYGREIVEKAKREGINFALAVEKSGSSTFELEHQEDFEKVIENINPTYIKALIRYNPDEKEKNKIQLENLSKLSEYIESSGRKLIVELLVPPTDFEKKNMSKFEGEIRIAKTIQALKEISQVTTPKIWKMEGFSKEGWEMIFNNTPFKMKVIVLGRGENKEKVEHWLSTAAQFPNIIGFAVGRTIFSQPLKALQEGDIEENESAVQISKNFENLVGLWNSQKN